MLDAEDAPQGRLRRPVAAHAVDAAAGRGGAGAEVEAAVGRRVGVVTGDGAGEELSEVVGPAADVAADHVRVVPFELDGVDGVARDDEVAEAGGEALDLSLDAFGHVHVRAVRDVAVGPARLLARGRARLVEEALLRDDDEGPLGVRAAPDGGLGLRDLLDGGAEVDGRRAPARLGPPRDGPAERPVDLEDAGAVPELRQALSVAAGQPPARYLDHLPRREVEEHGARLGQVAHGAHRVPGAYLAAVTLQTFGQR